MLQGKFENPVCRKINFFQILRNVALRTGVCNPSSHLRTLAATCSDSCLRPLAATRGHLQVAASGCHAVVLETPSGHLRPLAATRVAASGCHAVVPETPSGHLRPPSGHLRPLEWLQVAASGCKRLRVAASGCMWLPALVLETPQWPLAATRVAASGCEWLQVAAFLKFK